MNQYLSSFIIFCYNHLEDKPMTRISKQGKRRNQSPKKRTPRFSSPTGPKKDSLAKGYKEHLNALSSVNTFIPKIK